MKVLLKATWFIDGQRFKRSVSSRDPRFVPNHLRDKLPPTAVIVDEDAEASRPVLDAAAIATRVYKDALHANDHSELPDAGLGADVAAHAALAAAEQALADEDDDPVAAAKSLLADTPKPTPKKPFGRK